MKPALGSFARTLSASGGTVVLVFGLFWMEISFFCGLELVFAYMVGEIEQY
jgi:hypothetical protein